MAYTVRNIKPNKLPRKIECNDWNVNTHVRLRFIFTVLRKKAALYPMVIKYKEQQ